METFILHIQISDLNRERWLGLDALVNTGATMTSAPASLLRESGIESVSSHLFEFASGETRRMEIGYANVRLDGKDTIAQVVFDDEGMQPLIGSFTLDGLFLEFDPDTQVLIPKVGLMPSFWLVC